MEQQLFTTYGAAINPNVVGELQGQTAEACALDALSLDFNTCGAGCLPPNVKDMHHGQLTGKFMLQLDELVDIGAPVRQSQVQDIKRAQRVYGFELTQIKNLSHKTPAGAKIVVVNPRVRRGMLLLSGENCKLLGGQVPHLQALRQRLATFMGQPPNSPGNPMATQPEFGSGKHFYFTCKDASAAVNDDIVYILFEVFQRPTTRGWYSEGRPTEATPRSADALLAAAHDALQQPASALNTEPQQGGQADNAAQQAARQQQQIGASGGGQVFQHTGQAARRFQPQPRPQPVQQTQRPNAWQGPPTQAAQQQWQQAQPVETAAPRSGGAAPLRVEPRLGTLEQAPTPGPTRALPKVLGSTAAALPPRKRGIQAPILWDGDGHGGPVQGHHSRAAVGQLASARPGLQVSGASATSASYPTQGGFTPAAAQVRGSNAGTSSSTRAGVALGGVGGASLGQQPAARGYGVPTQAGPSLHGSNATTPRGQTGRPSWQHPSSRNLSGTDEAIRQGFLDAGLSSPDGQQQAAGQARTNQQPPEDDDWGDEIELSLGSQDGNRPLRDVSNTIRGVIGDGAGPPLHNHAEKRRRVGSAQVSGGATASDYLPYQRQQANRPSPGGDSDVVIDLTGEPSQSGGYPPQRDEQGTRQTRPSGGSAMRSIPEEDADGAQLDQGQVGGSEGPAPLEDPWWEGSESDRELSQRDFRLRGQATAQTSSARARQDALPRVGAAQAAPVPPLPNSSLPNGAGVSTAPQDVDGQGDAARQRVLNAVAAWMGPDDGNFDDIDKCTLLEQQPGGGCGWKSTAQQQSRALANGSNKISKWGRIYEEAGGYQHSGKSIPNAVMPGVALPRSGSLNDSWNGPTCQPRQEGGSTSLLQVPTPAAEVPLHPRQQNDNTFEEVGKTYANAKRLGLAEAQQLVGQDSQMCLVVVEGKVLTIQGMDFRDPGPDGVRRFKCLLWVEEVAGKVGQNGVADQVEVLIKHEVMQGLLGLTPMQLENGLEDEAVVGKLQKAQEFLMGYVGPMVMEVGHGVMTVSKFGDLDL